MSESREQARGWSGPVEAVVTRVDPDTGRVQVRGPDAPPHEARSAVHGWTPSEGDRVLVTVGADGHYVTGVLLSAPQVLRVGETTARVEDGALLIEDGRGETIVRVDSETGAVTLGAATLRIEAREALSLSAPHVSIEAERLDHRVGDHVTEAERVSVSADRWELRVNRLRQRAKNAFCDVEALLQTRAGTIRSIAREQMSLFARRTTIKSEKDTAVDGERVLLG